MYVGIDIGGTKCAVTLGDGLGEIKEKIRFDTLDLNGTLEKIFEAVESFDDFSSIGISCGGPLDPKSGIILSPPNLPGWDNVPIKDMLENKFGVCCALQNDANACALAEHTFGAGKGTENMVFLTFGTGLGAGIIVNGELCNGASGMAGEVGHVRLEAYGPVGYGKAGSFEGFCSGGGIAQIGRYKALERFQMGKKVAYCDSIDDMENITAKRIAECAKNGDESAKEIYEICAGHLGMGLSMIMDILNPEMIVIGGIYGRCRDFMEPVMVDVIKKEAHPLAGNVCRVLPAKLGEEIGDYAALAVAAKAYEKRRNK